MIVTHILNLRAGAPQKCAHCGAAVAGGTYIYDWNDWRANPNDCARVTAAGAMADDLELALEALRNTAAQYDGRPDKAADRARLLELARGLEGLEDEGKRNQFMRSKIQADALHAIVKGEPMTSPSVIPAVIVAMAEAFAGTFLGGAKASASVGTGGTTPGGNPGSGGIWMAGAGGTTASAGGATASAGGTTASASGAGSPGYAALPAAPSSSDDIKSTETVRLQLVKTERTNIEAELTVLRAIRTQLRAEIVELREIRDRLRGGK
jgi:hypothetical protein